MPQKRYRPEEIIAKLREAEVLVGQGKKVPEVVTVLGIGEVSSYRWLKARRPRSDLIRSCHRRSPAPRGTQGVRACHRL